MIHYHGTPCSGTRTDTAKFLAGRHALVPFPRPDDMGITADVCRSFCLDNGAFSAWKRGLSVAWSEYYNFTEKWMLHPGFDFAIIPDVIDGTEDQNDRLVKEWPHGHRGAPVWHMHESLRRLVTLALTWRTVCLGSSGAFATPGTAQWWGRMVEAMDAICDEEGRPLCRLHGLRMLNPKIFTKLPLASADSTNAARNSSSLERYGMYRPPSAAQRLDVLASRIEMHQSSPVWVRP